MCVIFRESGNPLQISGAVYKTLYRRKVRRLLDALSAGKRSRKSRIIHQRLFRNKNFLKARRILIYVSRPDEVDTHQLIQKALELGKQVLIPCFDSKSRKLVVSLLVQPVDNFRPGPYGVLQPPVSGRKATRLLPDLCIVPGIAFDRPGNRLGRGLGYFDRFLARRRPEMKVLALAFREQVLAAIPVEKHDIRIHQVITD